jgi:hypothetical protein
MQKTVKKLVLLLCLLAPMTLLAQTPASTLPALSAVIDPCAHADNSFCTYAWNKLTRCCNPTFIAQGAYCPQLCE